MGLWLARVDDIGELKGVLDEENLDRECWHDFQNSEDRIYGD